MIPGTQNELVLLDVTPLDLGTIRIHPLSPMEFEYSRYVHLFRYRTCRRLDVCYHSLSNFYPCEKDPCTLHLNACCIRSVHHRRPSQRHMHTQRRWKLKFIKEIAPWPVITACLDLTQSLASLLPRLVSQRFAHFFSPEFNLRLMFLSIALLMDWFMLALLIVHPKLHSPSQSRWMVCTFWSNLSYLQVDSTQTKSKKWDSRLKETLSMTKSSKRLLK